MMKDQYKYRNELLKKYIYLGLIISFGLAPIYYYIKIYYLAVTLNLFTISMIYLIFKTKQVNDFIINSRVFMTSITILFISGFINGNQEIDSKYFLLLYPIASFSIIGVKEGAIWSLIILISFIAVYLYIPDIYNLYSFMFFIVAFFMVSYLLYYYRYYEMLNFEHINEIQSRKDKVLLQQTKFVSMGIMLSSISHQWRQPLAQIASILVKLQLQKKYNKFTNKEFNKSIEDITNILKYMSMTIDDFRKYIKKDIEKEKFNLKETLEAVLKIADSAIKSLDIKINLNINSNITLYGNHSELMQVFLNIITNAKYIFEERETKSPKIDIKIYRNKKKIITLFCDNGGGIKKEVLTKIFEDFYTTREREGGSGLGLYIAKDIITKNFNGEIKAYNKKDGACFEIIISI